MVAPRIEQAIFTSQRSERVDGYHLVAASGGVSSRDQRELAKWGPAHDSLVDAGLHAESINAHRLASGMMCVSRTIHAGAEYSGRGGFRVYTVFLLLEDTTLARFANHPFRLFKAALATGHLHAKIEIPKQLESFALAGRASPVNQILLARLARSPGAAVMAALVEAVLNCDSVAVGTGLPLAHLMAGLVELLPISFRGELTFSSGLKPSSQRPFRIQPLDPKAAGGKARQRKNSPSRLLLDEIPPDERDFSHPWAQVVARLLQPDGIPTLARLLRRDGAGLSLEGLAEEAFAQFQHAS